MKEVRKKEGVQVVLEDEGEEEDEDKEVGEVVTQTSGHRMAKRHTGQPSYGQQGLSGKRVGLLHYTIRMSCLLIG